MIHYGICGDVYSGECSTHQFGLRNGDLTGWTTQGNVEVLQSTNFAPNIAPPEGRYFVLLSTGLGNSSAPNNGDLDGDGNPDNDVTILNQTFSSGSGSLCFTWSWLTDEENEFSGLRWLQHVNHRCMLFGKFLQDLSVSL